jgi:hypothetical protein
VAVVEKFLGGAVGSGHRSDPLALLKTEMEKINVPHAQHVRYEQQQQQQQQRRTRAPETHSRIW